MSDKTQEELEEEFKSKLQEIQLELEEVADHEFGPEIIAALGLEDEERTETDIKRGFRAHWVLPTDVSFNSCDNIEDVESAQRVFAEFASSKTDKNEVQVLPGDILILTCNHSKIEDEKDENGDPTGQSYFTDACYYVGMCISSEDLKDRNLELHEEALITAFEGNQGDVGRQFIAWDTCGSSDDCPEDPDTIQIDEIVIPDDDGSPGQEKGLVVKSEGYRSKLAEINQLKSLVFTKGTGSSSVDPSFAGFDTSQGSGIEELPKNTGLLVHLKNLHLNSTPFAVSGTSDTVSLFSTTTTLQQANYKAVTIESKTVSISSDSCGELKKVSLSGSEYTKSVEVLKKDVSGSTQEYTVGTLEANETPGSSVSLGNVSISSVSLGVRPFAGQHFLPELTLAEAEAIDADSTIPVASNIQFTVSSTNATTDANGCTKKTFSFNLTADVHNLIFASGVLIRREAQSPALFNFTHDLSVCAAPPTCNSCPGVAESVAPFTTCRIERRVNGSWTHDYSVSYTGWQATNSCNGSFSTANFTPGLTTQTPSSGTVAYSIHTTQGPPCGYDVVFKPYSQNPAPIATFQVADITPQNPVNGDKRYLFS